MATTTNYGWTTPNDTDLVKDGAAAIRTLGSSVDTTTKALNPSTTLGDIEYRSATANTNTRLPIGTTGQILSVVGGVPSWVANDVGDITAVSAGTGISGGGTSGDITITNSMATAIDAKGDLVVGTGADTFSKLTVGANNTVLTADSSTATGLKWAAPASSSGPAFLAYRSSNTATVNGVWTKTPFDSESFDTDSCYSTTNYRFTPNKAGYYNINTQVLLTISPVKWAQMRLYFNGNIVRNTVNESQDSAQSMKISTLFYFNGSSDYLEVYYYIEGTGDVNGNSTNFPTWFDGIWIRS